LEIDAAARVDLVGIEDAQDSLWNVIHRDDVLLLKLDTQVVF